MLASKHRNRLQGRFSIAVMSKGFYNQSMKKLLRLLSASMLINALIASNGFAAASSGYRLFPNMSSTCTDASALNCFVGQVWNFSQTAILLLSIAAFVIAGIIYMTSTGNPKQIEMAKKIIIGALSAVAVMVLGKFFLTNVVGIKWIN